MSSFHSDKCTKEELLAFKKEVLGWLAEIGITKPRARALRCYNGEVRVYTGESFHFPNQKASFRKEKEKLDDNGNIIGWTGTRGIHTTEHIQYVAINRDEFDYLKGEWYADNGYNTEVEELKKLVQ
jgi:hypothetical protein